MLQKQKSSHALLNAAKGGFAETLRDSPRGLGGATRLVAGDSTLGGALGLLDMDMLRSTPERGVKSDVKTAIWRNETFRRALGAQRLPPPLGATFGRFFSR